MRIISRKILAVGLFALFTMGLTACSSTDSGVFKTNRGNGSINDPIYVISSLGEQQRDWKGTRYRLGGTTRSGVDCSGFMQVTFRDLFGINLPRMTVDQAKVGKHVSKGSLQTGDLVFFKTGRGPNGRHVGVYVKDGQFLHASTKGGVIYSDINSPYWSKTYWQARRL
ncbi:endopeptidase [Pasteurellaceae bacterium 15-036681]|nr:endopeptidase [Pasteurellaceae bacterium 15-036681]